MSAISFVSDAEIDRRMEEAINESNLWVMPPDVFDIERFIEKHLDCRLDVSAPLADGIMGDFVFTRDESPCVRINAGLTEETDNSEERWMQGRWRMTAAHESAHVLLHLPFLIAKSTQEGLWDKSETLVYRCYENGERGSKERFDEADLAKEKSDLIRRYGWNSGLLVNDTPTRQRMEFQANRGGAALLMPLSRFQQDARKACCCINKGRADWTRRRKVNWVIQKLAERYTVSFQAASIRFEQLELACHLDNLTLF